MKMFDKLISSFVFDKFKGDWVIDDFLKTYIKKKSNPSSIFERVLSQKEAGLGS